MQDCIFCRVIDSTNIVLENNFAISVFDKFPVTNGHILVIPKRHFADFFEITAEEYNAVLDLLHEMRSRLMDTDSTIDGFNIGINVGQAAGQTVMHCHIHLIPRRSGDIDNPRGGIRGVIPGKRIY